MICAVRSDVGKRPGNEDSYYVPGEATGLYIIADGMGGHNAGEVASHLAVSFIVAQVMLGRNLPPHERLRIAVQRANAQIYERACSSESLSGMGTTLTMAYIDEGRMTIAHIGDSRAYLLHEGRLIRLTNDHTLIEELVRAGQVTPEAAETYPYRNVITRALGTMPTTQIDIVERTFEDGDILVLCSDGLTDTVTNEEIETTLRSSATLDEMADALMELVVSRNGQDNTTILLAREEERT